MLVTATTMATAALPTLMSAQHRRHLTRLAPRQTKELASVGVTAVVFGAHPKAPWVYRHLYGDEVIYADLFAVG